MATDMSTYSDGATKWVSTDINWYDPGTPQPDTDPTTGLPQYTNFFTHDLPDGASVALDGQTYSQVTVWGAGLVSFGAPTAGQISFFSGSSLPTSASGFPGSYLAFDNLGHSQDSYFIGTTLPDPQLNIAASLTISFLPGTTFNSPTASQVSFSATGITIGGPATDGPTSAMISGHVQYSLNQQTDGQGETLTADRTLTYSSLQSPACYAEGTLILTDRGERAIETLVAGDTILTPQGLPRAILWVGRRTVDCARFPRPDEVYPYVIRRDALSDGVPTRDLYLSPGHCVALTVVEPVLIAVAQLANEASIAQVRMERVTYWHLEIEGGALAVANGTAAESFVDVGNRQSFEGGDALALFADLDSRGAVKALPQIVEGPVLSAVRTQLVRRAEALGWTAYRRCVELQIDVDGVAAATGPVRAVYRLPSPPGSKSLTLRSPTFRPAMDPAVGADTRTLGTAVRCVTAIGPAGERHELDLSGPCFAQGFWDVEHDALGAYRWTNGAATIDLSQLDPGHEIGEVEIDAQLVQPVWSDAGAPGERQDVRITRG